jgi:hypothetical protein
MVNVLENDDGERKPCTDRKMVVALEHHTFMCYMFVSGGEPPVQDRPHTHT